jgi:hypothetical protein
MNCATHDSRRMIPLPVPALAATMNSFAISMALITPLNF